MAEPCHHQSKSQLKLLSAAESRIDTATAELFLALNGVTDACRSQQVAITELREAGEALKLLRERIEHPTS
jgi:hypothetical protein